MIDKVMELLSETMGTVVEGMKEKQQKAAAEAPVDYTIWSKSKLIEALMDAKESRIRDRERYAVIAEGGAKNFDFQRAFAEMDDWYSGYNTARLEIAKAIREEE